MGRSGVVGIDLGQRLGKALDPGDSTLGRLLQALQDDALDLGIQVPIVVRWGPWRIPLVQPGVLTG